MSKYIKQFTFQAITILAIVAVYFYPDYAWVVKTILYPLYTIGLLIQFQHFGNTDKYFKDNEKSDRKPKIYNFLSHFYSVIILGVFILSDFRLLFVMRLVTILLASVLRNMENDWDKLKNTNRRK